MNSAVAAPPLQVRHDPVRAGRLSVIVPVLNESRLIGAFLRRLRERAPHAEIIVADGGSTDGTLEIARDKCDLIVHAPPSRARQMNAGAAAATGDVLWFLHVDADVSPESVAEISRGLEGGVAGGYFRIQLPKNNFVYRLTDSFAHYAGFVLRIRCGDHGFFCRRDVFQKLGGYPDLPLMEDVEFFRKLFRAGRVHVVARRMRVSPRRYEAIGPFRLTLAYGLIAMLYVMRVPVTTLAALYRRLCSPL